MAETQFEISLSTGTRWFHQTSLDNLVDQFFQGRTGISLGEAENKTLQSLGFALTVRKTAPLGDRARLVSSLRFGKGKTTYLLPNGVRPFIDPITLRFDHVSLSPSLSVERDIKLGNSLRLTTGFGAGLDVLRSRSSAQSALLNVRREETHRDGHLLGNLRLSTSGKTSAGLDLQMRWSRRAGVDVVLGHSLRF